MPEAASAATPAAGSNADFRHTLSTTASRAAVWALWADPATWGSWDKGLKSARADGALALGATGQITPRSGPPSKFKIVEWAPGERYAFETDLPLAKLRVRRFFEPGDTTRFTHHVTFSGPMAGVWASRFGPGFRQALPPTMAELAARAEAPAGPIAR